MASHDANEVHKVKQPIIWGNVIGIMVFHLVAAYGLFTLPLTQIRWQTYLWGKNSPFYLLTHTRIIYFSRHIFANT
jgi:hypothetical protein